MIQNGMIVIKDNLLYPNNPRSYESYIPEFLPSCIEEQYFAEQKEKLHPQVYVENPFIDFGSCSPLRLIEPKLLRVTNKSRGKMNCSWVIPK
jgi:hypothetical protein